MRYVAVAECGGPEIHRISKHGGYEGVRALFLAMIASLGSQRNYAPQPLPDEVLRKANSLRFRTQVAIPLTCQALGSPQVSH